MVNRLKDNISLTLVEVLVAMLILSVSAAGILGSFSYSYKFIRRAGQKIDAMNYGRKALDAFRAIWLCNTGDTRLADTGPGPAPNWVDIKTSSDPKSAALVTNFSGIVYYSIITVGGNKEISVKVDWNAP